MEISNKNYTQSSIHSNLLFVLADVLESNLMDTNSLLRKEDKELRHDAKRNFNLAISAVRRIKTPVSHCSDTTQESFGNDSDMIYQIIKLLIDRCGDDDMKLFKFFNYIKTFPSQLNMDIDDSVFSHIFNTQSGINK